jgi:activator of HSP90 ATPase
MKTTNIKQAPSFAAPPDDVFKAWLDSAKHGAMIGANARIDPKIGGKFSVWDGFATGETLELDRTKHRIVQSWRDNTTDWPQDYYSKITLEFAADKSEPARTRLHFWHCGIPTKHVDSIAKGWKDYYWQPMQDYFKTR